MPNLAAKRPVEVGAHFCSVPPAGSGRLKQGRSLPYREISTVAAAKHRVPSKSHKSLSPATLTGGPGS